MHPIKAMEAAIKKIEHAFTIARVVVHEASVITRGMDTFFIPPGTYPVSEDTMKPDMVLLTASPRTANHLYARGVADLHMENGEVKRGVPMALRCREQDRLARKAMREESL